MSQTIGGVELEQRFIKITKDVHDSVARAITMLTTELERIVKEEKLSGQVLHTRSSNLRNSITHQVTDDGSSISGVVYTDLNVIPYARIHEFGGIIQAKNAPYLKFQIGGKWFQKKSVIMPERSYLRSSLRDIEPRIQAVIDAELKKVL